MTIEDFAASVPNFGDISHADRIRLFAWFLHVHARLDTFSGADISRCYDALHLAPPTSVGPFLTAMVKKRPPELLKDRNGFRLERRLRELYDGKYGRRASTIVVDALLSDLSEKISDAAERGYLDEALKCFRVGAFRASIVMAWNLAYDHLCRWVFEKHLPLFNQQLPKSYPKADISSVAKFQDFSELKEAQVLQVARSAGITSTSLHKVLKEKLDRRNISAHPSGIIVSQLTAEEFIKDLVDNVVLAIV